MVQRRKLQDEFYFQVSNPSLVASVVFCPGQWPPIGAVLQAYQTAKW